MDRNTKLTARNGREVDALHVFSHSIRYLKDQAIEIIQERTGDEHYSAKDIQWVITVPAIWKPAAKQFMREAAYKVKYYQIAAKRLMITRHVTSHYVRTKKNPHIVRQAG